MTADTSRPTPDFPYYEGRPVALSAVQWALLMVAVFAAFLVLTLPLPFMRGTISGFVPVLLYVGIPLAALAAMVGRHWRALFRPLRARDFLYMIGFALLNVVVAFTWGKFAMSFIKTTPNAAVAGLEQFGTLDLVLFYVRAIPQLLGEEVMSVLPFLALMTWLVGGLNVARRTAIVLATLAVALLFAAAHLPTYGWNVLQAVVGVGVARIVLLLPYLLTKNILVCAGAHILNDWIFFTIPLALAAGAATKGG